MHRCDPGDPGGFLLGTKNATASGQPVPWRCGRHFLTDAVFFGAGITRDDRAVLPQNRDRPQLRQSDRLVKFFEILGPDRCDDRTEKLAARSADTARDDDRRPAVGTVLYRHPQETGRLVVQPKIRDKVAIREVGGRNRPTARRIYSLAIRINQRQGIGLRQILQPIGQKLVPFPAGKQLFELRGRFDAGTEYPVLDLIQHEVDRLQCARRLLGEGDTEIFDFLAIGLHRLPPQIPDCQDCGHQGHANDCHADQVEAAIGWRMPPQAREKLHY